MHYTLYITYIYIMSLWFMDWPHFYSQHNRSALLWVASFGYVATAQALLDHKANVSLQTEVNYLL